MLTIISDASIANAISTNQLLAVAHRLLNEHMDEPSFNKVCIVRYGAGFVGRALRVELTRQPDRKIAENWEWAGAAVGASAETAAGPAGSQPEFVPPGSAIYTTRST